MPGRDRADTYDVEEQHSTFASPRADVDLRWRATHDPLTGLLDRSALLCEVEVRLTRGPVTAICCNLDGFRRVNHTYGSASGDELLVGVARLLTSMARSNDAIGRVGGDEFVIVCDGLARPHTTNLIARLGDALDVVLGVRVSVGVAGSREGGSGVDLLGRAERAMYENKRRVNRPLQDGPLLR